MPECLEQFLGGVCVGIALTGIVIAIAHLHALAHFRGHGHQPSGKPQSPDNPPRGGSGVPRKGQGR